MEQKSQKRKIAILDSVSPKFSRSIIAYYESKNLVPTVKQLPIRFTLRMKMAGRLVMFKRLLQIRQEIMVQSVLSVASLV